MIRQLKDRRNELIDGFLNGETSDFLRNHAAILDDYFRRCFEAGCDDMQPDHVEFPYTMIALGGYGRSEQCVFSDIDLLILFEKVVPKEAERVVQVAIYPLWDIGLEVGHAIRSIKECLDLASENYQVLTSLLDARFICGMSELFVRLMEEVREKILLPKSGDIIQWLIESNQARHQRVGDCSYLLEPNLKEGQGGLRDYHTMLWIVRTKSNMRHYRDLEYFGYLSHDEYGTFRKALEFVWFVRNHLHTMSGRKCDRLHFQNQITMATALNFKPVGGQQPVEVFLGKLHGQMAFIKEQHQMFLCEQEYANKKKPNGSRVIRLNIEDLKVSRDRLTFSTPEAILKNPMLLIKIFEESARLNIPLALEAKRLVTEFGFLADDNMVTSGGAVRSFKKIVSTAVPTYSVLNSMLQTGLLVRFIPEFKKIVDRVQYDEYHLYPVDLHSFRAVRLLKTFGTDTDASGESLCGELYAGLNEHEHELLLFASLLHDIGKGEPGNDHSAGGAETATVILLRMGYEPEAVETAAFLIRHHLLLAKTATRRDLNDEETAIACARIVQDEQRLKMLYLLTVADSMATGPKAWSIWTASLLRDLFFKVSNVLERGKLASGEAVRTVETKKAYLLSSTLTDEDRKSLESLLKSLSPRYLLYVPAEAIMGHIKLYRDLGDSDFIWRVKPEMGSKIREVTICARDRPGLISKIAGVFTLNGINIMDTQVFTWRNHIALDIFRVEPPPDRIFESERWERAAEHLSDALSGKLDLAAALEERLARNRSAAVPAFCRPNRIVVDNDSSSFFTIIEVYTYDFSGLLYSVANALLECEIDLWVAKIATYVDQVVDVFYVRDYDGQKVGAAQASRIQSTIESALSVCHPR